MQGGGKVLANTSFLSVISLRSDSPLWRKPELILPCEWKCIYTIVFCV